MPSLGQQVNTLETCRQPISKQSQLGVIHTAKMPVNTGLELNSWDLGYTYTIAGHKFTAQEP